MEGVGVEAAAGSPERQKDLLKLLDAVTHDEREARLRCVRATDENAALRAELGVARQRLDGWPEVTDSEVRLVVDGKATDSLLCEKLLRTRLEDPSALASLLRKDD